jgi:Putative adhesin
VRLRLPRSLRARLSRPPRPLSPAGRRGLVGVGLAMTAAAVGAAGLVAVNAMARQTVRELHTYAFKGSAVSVDARLGEVQIVPGRPGEITVARRLTYGLRRPFVDERNDGDTFRVRDRRCTADAAFPCAVRWLLQVPRGVALDVQTQAGSITVSGLSGTMKLVSVSGSVRAIAPSGKLVSLRSTTGSVTAQSVSGDQVVATSTTGAVTVTFREPPSLVVGRSETGPVGVVLPDGNDGYRISAKSVDGSKTVALSGAKDDPEARRRIDIRSTKGDVSVLQSPEH